MAIPKECKRLAEVDFPIAKVSRHAVREKSIRHGHPSTLHLWWARRPLAACRAMLMALLLPDPADPHCPAEFRQEARRILREKEWRSAGWQEQVKDDIGLRKALLDFIADFANWDNAADETYLTTARGLVKAAHPEETPLVVDPFAGGGSIPLEALRVGCDAFASDLNPVACLINKVMLEDIPRYGRAKIPFTKNDGTVVEADGLAEALRIAGAEVRATATAKLAEFYPSDSDGAQPVAYIWARTVRCESPNCGAEIPLTRSFWLAKKASRKVALRYRVERLPSQPPHLNFEIIQPQRERDVPQGTVSRARATCPCCGAVLPPERVRAQLVAQRGGSDVDFDSTERRSGGAFLLAVVTKEIGSEGRKYRIPTADDYGCVLRAQRKLQAIESQLPTDALNWTPTEPLPLMSGTFNVPLYGMSTWGDIFTARQKLALAMLADIANEAAAPLRELLAICVDRVADGSAAISSWLASGEEIKHVFSRQALPMVWDFGESNYFADVARTWSSAINAMCHVIHSLAQSYDNPGQVQQADACHSPLPDAAAGVWFTDPPYYFAVPYADLSDFFYVWLKRSLSGHPVFGAGKDRGNALTPKEAELCEMAHWDTMRYAHKDKSFFESGMTKAFQEGKRVLDESGIGCVVFAHKTTEGWEALLSGLVGAEWVIASSWPLATEAGNRLRARDSAALATSVHLVCRPRTEGAPVGDWSMVYRELPHRISAWMTRLEAEGIRGADLVFACIGPALELYSQYSQVVDAEDRPIPLGGDPTASEPYKRGYLAYVWETVARLALEQVLGTGQGQQGSSLEEDARLTALFLWTLQSTGSEDPLGAGNEEVEVDDADEEDDEEAAPSKTTKGFSLPFDVVRRFAQPLGIHLPVWENRIIEQEKGVVRLRPVADRARQLFGEEGADAVAGELESSPLSARNLQLQLFPDAEAASASTGRGRRRGSGRDADLSTRREATTLDRVHAAMLLQKAGRTQALRTLLAAEQERGPMFLRLANALSGLYPKTSEEKRLLDAMLLAYPK